MHIEVFTDGSATTADKPGGWGYVLVVDGVKHSEGNGHMPNATNNDAEMQAVIEGLKAALAFSDQIVDTISNLKLSDTTKIAVTVKSDSQLILGWTSGVFAFKQQDKLEKYKELRALVGYTGAKTEWVRGHNGNEHNERCDKLANLGRLQKQEELDRKDAKDRGDTLIGTKKTGILCVWYKGVLKIIDLDKNVVENHNRDSHGARGAVLEIKEDKHR